MCSSWYFQLRPVSYKVVVRSAKNPEAIAFLADPYYYVVLYLINDKITLAMDS